MQWSHNTTPRYGQYLTHAHSHITRAAAAMDSCFVLIRTHQHGIARRKGLTEDHRPRRLLPRRVQKHSFKGKPFHVGDVQTSSFSWPSTPAAPSFCWLTLFAFFVCKLYDPLKFIQHYSTILNTTLLCDVEQGGQTYSLLLITPENKEKVESVLRNTAQGGTPENKRNVG